MKMFLKIAALMLAVLMCVSLFACSKDDGDTQDENDDGVAYNVTYNGTKIKLGAKADSVIEKLGEPQDTREIGDCGGLGALVKYSYSSIEVYVLKSKTEGNIIDQITLRDDLVATPEGVCIGDSAEGAKEKLGAPTKESSTALTYESEKYALKLLLSDGSVTGIDYLTR